MCIRDRSRLLAVEETRCPDREVHYLSMEFLMGRSLMKNAFNLGIANALTGALEDLGRNASDIFEAENDAGLGNGGLGRLAACYLDSMTTLDIPAAGYSICYELGIFKQKIVEGQQVELPDNWLGNGNVWEMPVMEDRSLSLLTMESVTKIGMPWAWVGIGADPEESPPALPPSTDR